MSVKGFLIGMLAGTVVGVLVALLFAPQSGADTRRRVSNSARSVRDRASGATTGLKEKIAHGAENVRQAI